VAKKGFEKNEGLSLKLSPLLPHNQLGPGPDGALLSGQIFFSSLPKPYNPLDFFIFHNIK